jgi:hypothetical protein
MQPQGAPAPNRGPGHEVTDASVRGIFQFAAGLAIFGIALHFTLGAVMRGFNNRATDLERRRPTRFVDQTGQFPAPNLQESPSADMRAYRQEERDELARYGWVDRNAGIVQLPLDRAMFLVGTHHGLPRLVVAAPDAKAASPPPEAKQEPQTQQPEAKPQEPRKPPPEAKQEPQQPKPAEAKKEPEAK